MMKAGLFVASALALTSSAGAVLAQQPLEYVRVCDAYGTGFYYVPGTDTCIHASTGQTRVDTENGTVVGQSEIARKADKALSGAALSSALTRPLVESGHRFAISGDVAGTEDSGALSLGAGYRINEHLTVSGSGAVGENGGAAGRGGFNYSW
jgi:hypothetical protein